MNNKNQIKGIGLVSAAGIIFGAFPIFTSLFVAYGGNTDSFNFIGFVLAVIFLIPIILYRKTGFVLPGKMLWYVILAGIANAVTRVLLTYSYLSLDVGIATTIHFVYPIITAILSFAIFKEKMPLYKWIIFVIASLSVSLFASGNGGGDLKGVILAASSSICFATYILITDKSGLAECDPFVVLFYVSLISTVTCFIFGLKGGHLFDPIPAKAVFVLLLCAIVNNIVGFFCQLKGIGHLGAAMAAILSLFEPIFSCIFGAVFLDQALNASSILGIILILGSLVVMVLLDNRPAANKNTNNI